jgi:hypothetical protein
MTGPGVPAIQDFEGKAGVELSSGRRRPLFCDRVRDLMGAERHRQQGSMPVDTATAGSRPRAAPRALKRP